MAVAVLSEATLTGDQFRVILKMPAGIAQPDQGFFVSAASTDVVAAIANAARPATTHDAQIKQNRSILQPGLVINLDPPAPPLPSDPTPDDLAVEEFAASVRQHELLSIKNRFGLGGVTDAAVEAQVLATQALYAKATPTQLVRFDAVLPLLV